MTQHAIGALNANLKDFGFVIIGVFLGAWVLSYLIYRFTDLDEVEVRVADPASGDAAGQGRADAGGVNNDVAP